jgi:putative peptidoglycan lipid II flippase
MSAWLQALMLYRRLGIEGVYQAEQGWGLHWLRIGLSLAAMAALLLWLLPPLEVWTTLEPMRRAFTLLGIIGAAALTYLVSLLALGLRPRHLHA